MKRSNSFLLVYGAPLLLVVVAVVQIILTQTVHLTPWKGGGFGMFAAIESRTLHAFLRSGDGRIPLHLPPELQRRIAIATAAPGDRALRDLAASLAGRAWIVEPSAACAVACQELPQSDGLLKAQMATPAARSLARGEPAPEGSAPLDFVAVEVEVWTLELDSDQGQVSVQVVNSASADRERP